MRKMSAKCQSNQHIGEIKEANEILKIEKKVTTFADAII